MPAATISQIPKLNYFLAKPLQQPQALMSPLSEFVPILEIKKL